MLFTGLIIAFLTYTHSKFLYHIMNVYVILILFINILLLISDLELYSHWKFRMDSTPLRFLGNPGEAFASVTWTTILRQIILGSVLFALSYFSYRKLIGKQIKNLQKTNWSASLLFLALTALSFIQMRGGLSIVPINISAAYHSKNMFTNHATINLFWNVGQSLIEQKNIKNDYLFFKNKDAEKIVAKMCQKNDSTTNIFTTEKPNIVFIILESFTAKVIKPLGGLDSITPNFNALAKEGILFRNCFANGDRSDKGIAALLSGFPALPNVSVMQYPGKTQKLPFFSKELKQLGYHTSFYYGGNPDFANIKSYLLTAGFETLISSADFEKKENTAKWGVHDHIVFEKLFQDIASSKQPFFKVFFTLSSHDPFDIPKPHHFTNRGDDSKYLSSVYYADKALGTFIAKAKKTNWWKNTIIILVADHGSLRPGNSGHFAEESFRIPLLICGGAINKKDTVFTNYISQTDLAYSLLLQLHEKCDSFKYSKDIFTQNTPSFSFYAFNNGFGFFTDSSKVIWDHISKSYITKSGSGAEKDSEKGKAFIQVVFENFLEQ